MLRELRRQPVSNVVFVFVFFLEPSSQEGVRAYAARTVVAIIHNFIGGSDSTHVVF